MRKNALQDLMKLKDITLKNIRKKSNISSERLNFIMLNDNVVLEFQEIYSLQKIFNLDHNETLFYFFN